MTREIASDDRTDSVIIQTYLGSLLVFSGAVTTTALARLGVGPADLIHLIEVGVGLLAAFMGGDPGITGRLMVATWIPTVILITLITVVGLGALAIHFGLLYGLRGLVWIAQKRAQRRY